MLPQPVLLLLYRMAITVINGLAACFGPLGHIPYRKVCLIGWMSSDVLIDTHPQQEADVDCHSDEELLKLCQSIPLEQWASLGTPLRLTSDVVGKLLPWPLTGWPSEALAQELVHNKTSIPIDEAGDRHP